jgi:hypothetical protein
MNFITQRRAAAARGAVVALATAAAGVAPALGARVLVLASGDAGLDAAVQTRLAGFGHQVTMGPAYTAFTGDGLTGQQVVYLQASVNWSAGDMPDAGQAALVAFVNGGGGLVTAEWTEWKVGALNQLQTLAAALPAVATADYNSDTPLTFDTMTTDPLIDAGLPASFVVTPDNVGGGTVTPFVATPTATTFFATEGHGALIGWTYGTGRVAQFVTCNGMLQVADTTFGRLLSNTMDWAAQSGACAADITGDGALNIQDFLAFLQLFASADSRADFDHNGSVNVQDFLGFLQAYGVGC